MICDQMATICSSHPEINVKYFETSVTLLLVSHISLHFNVTLRLQNQVTYIATSKSQMLSTYSHSFIMASDDHCQWPQKAFYGSIVFMLTTMGG